MNPLAGFSYYEMLEVSRSATREDVEAAYRRMHVIYGLEGLAAYSLFTPEERNQIMLQLEEAYQVLSDDYRRREYDEVLAVQRPPAPPDAGPQPGLPFDEDSSPAPAPVPAEPAPLPPPEEAPPPDPPKEITGESLRRYREALGLSLDRIWERTRIRKGLIQAIEEENRGLLPASVFLKGMLLAYARALNLAAPEAVAQQYLDHIATHAS
jgi:hypothetical protein